MGASQTKAEVLNEVMNTASIDVLTRNSNSASGNILQSNTFTLAGDVGGKYSNIEQINTAKINVTGLMTAVQNGSLQSDLAATMSNTIKQQASAIGYASTDSKVSTIVSSTINSRITTEAMQTIQATVSQSNVIQLLGNNNSAVTALKQKNEAELILKLVSDTNSSIIASMQTSGAISNDLDQFAGTSFGMLAGMAVLFALFIVFIWLFKGSFDNIVTQGTKPAPMLLIGCVILAYMFTHKSSDSSAGTKSPFYGGCPCQSM